MTSWKRGHTCQQHLTTIQPSRPSKAQPVQRLQLFLHITLLSWRDAVVHTAWFFIPQGFGSLTAGVVATINTALPFQNYMLPKTRSAFILYVPPVFCFVLSRVCVMFTSLNLKPVFLQKGGVTLWHRTVTEQGLHLVLTSVKKGNKAGESKVNILRCKWKGERNAMFIVALYLVIKEHKICLWLFLCEHSLTIFSFNIFFCYGSGGSCNFFTCIPFHLALLFLPSICIDSISVFAPPTCFRCHTFSSSPSVSLNSVPVEHGHKSARLCWFSQMWTNSCRGKTATQCCSRANKTLSSLCYNFVRNVYIFLFLCIT